MLLPVDIANQELRAGVKEPEAFYRYCDGDRVPWCAAFVLWCWRQSAAPDLPGNRWRNRAVWHLQRSLHEAGFRVDWPRQGDIVIMTRAGSYVEEGRPNFLAYGSPGHVGFFVGHTYEGLLCIEGNVGDVIVERLHIYPPQHILAFYRPPTVSLI